MSGTILNTVVRCHIKNTTRLKSLEGCIQSWQDKKLGDLGKLYLVDDQSPMEEEVVTLSKEYCVEYFRTPGPPDTKGGLYWSLKIQQSFPVLCCVDDMIFGKGSLEMFKAVLEQDVDKLPKNWGMIGTFACYESGTRNSNLIHNTKTNLWNIKNEILYALVCHIFSPHLSNILVKDWEAILAGTMPNPHCCDDIWVARTCTANSIPNYNTGKDYAQHTGINNRTFSNDGNSTYQTNFFVGE